MVRPGRVAAPVRLAAMGRRRMGVSGALVALLLVAGACSTGPDSHAYDDVRAMPGEQAAAGPAPEATARADFRAFGSIGQASVVDARRGDHLVLVDADG